MYKLLLLLVIVLSSLTLRAQSIDSTFLEEKFNFYSKKHSSASLFLHIDKSIYTSNEKIWFAAYLINLPRNQANHHLLSIFLVGEDSRRIELDGKFQIQKGHSTGSIRLPDTIPPGRYQLISYTNVLDNSGSPVAQFSVPIEIKSITQQSSGNQIGLRDSVQRKDKMRLNKMGIVVRFFPEGGNLADGLPGQLAWEARTAQGAPIAVTGLLIQGEKVIDTVETNSYGTGRFMLSPDAGSIYTLKVRANGYLLRDTVFDLPKSRQNYLQLHLTEAVVNDTLNLRIYSLQRKAVQIIVHNYQNDYAYYKTSALPELSKIRLPLKGLPKGLSTITILDESGRPLAERLFFAHYDKTISTAINSEKDSYSINDSVKITIKMLDHPGRPVQGMFSAAVVQDTRVRGTLSDIETSVYLNHNLGKLPPDPLGQGLGNKDYVENILVIKGWRRYTWQDFVDTKAGDTLQHNDALQIKGNIKLRNKAVKSPVTVFAMNGEGTKIIETEQNGSFDLMTEQLLAAEGHKVNLIVNGTQGRNYQININDPYLQINNRMVQKLDRGYTNQVIGNSGSESEVLKGLQHNINLQTVNIKANNRNGSLHGYHGVPGVNECGDYVDEHDYLNYAKSVNRFKPISGKMYQIRTDLEGNYFEVKDVYYHGCTEEKKISGLTMNAIGDGKEYYVTEEEKSNNPHRSTIYWQSGLLTNSAGEAELKFSTGELTGQFRLIIQGVTTDNLISGYGSVTVK